ncbi:MAG: DNA/RNA non-specific endonuclease [Verrucomicrobiota bacterium]
MPSKRTKKKTDKRRAKKASRKHSKSLNKNGFGKLAKGGFVLFLAVLALASAAYFFGSFEIREHYHQIGISSTQALRSSGWLPGPAISALDRIYDKIPDSEGFSVDGGEIGREESHFLAGQPRSRRQVQLLRNRSYFNLFSTSDKQAQCVAIRLIKQKPRDANIKIPFIRDPRIKNLQPAEMRLGKWAAYNLGPVIPLERQHGEIGVQEANLFTNLVPMTETFAQGIWQEVIREFALRYPMRFEEVWLYLGPIYEAEGQRMASGVTIPNAFYIIVFDLTEAGGLRALSLIIPADASGDQLEPYISSIGEIEHQTGMQFLPGLESQASNSLEQWISPSLW